MFWRLQGLYQDRPKLPFVPGSEVSGVVIEVGRDVRTVAVGDSVRAPLYVRWGLVGLALVLTLHSLVRCRHSKQIPYRLHTTRCLLSCLAEPPLPLAGLCCFCLLFMFRLTTTAYCRFAL